MAHSSDCCIIITPRTSRAGSAGTVGQRQVVNDTIWLTAADAAKILRVSQRQVHRYGEHKQLVTRRAGRRTLFSAASVAQLADDLAVDVCPPAPQARDLMTPELARYLTEQAELMRRQGESAERIEQRLAAIEQHVSRPAQAQFPPLVLALLLGLVALVAILILVLVIRGA